MHIDVDLNITNESWIQAQSIMLESSKYKHFIHLMYFTVTSVFDYGSLVITEFT